VTCAAAMSRRAALCLSLLLAACSGGGGSSAPLVTFPPWASFRHDNSNTGLASGSVDENGGSPELFATGFGVTRSTPAISLDGFVYLGTGNGLLSLDDTGAERWRLERCDLAGDGTDCPSSTCVEIGPIESSPALTPNGDIVVGSDGTGQGGYVFGISDVDGNPVCRWIFRPDGASAAFRVRSSAVTVIDTLDLALLSAFVGTSDGHLQALNGNGTSKWIFPGASSTLGNLTSSPALSPSAKIYTVAADGLLYALNTAGRLIWQFDVGTPRFCRGGDGDGAPCLEDSDCPGGGTCTAPDLLPSPAVGASVYVNGAGNDIVAVNVDGTLKWRYQTMRPVLGSPAVIGEFVTENDVTQLETIVDVVDDEGTVYGIRDTTGSIVSLLRCSESNDQCASDADCPSGQTCEAREGMVDLTSEAVGVTGSPIVSADSFIVAGTVDGRVCARRLDGTVPGEGSDPQTAAWESGCVDVGPGPVESSPVIDLDGVIYVTMNDGLYVIR
jgi:Cys-rich repeat protein